MTKRYKVRYYKDDDLYQVRDRSLEIEVLQLSADSDGITYLAAVNEARIKILEDLAIEYTVTEIKP